jgi:hypothetical protein
LSADYRENGTWIGFMCFLPFMLGILVIDTSPALFLVGAGLSAGLSVWAFWRWFKGYGSSRYSARKVEEHRKLMAARRNG